MFLIYVGNFRAIVLALVNLTERMMVATFDDYRRIRPAQAVTSFEGGGI
jgi:hypothetical protein